MCGTRGYIGQAMAGASGGAFLALLEEDMKTMIVTMIL